MKNRSAEKLKWDGKSHGGRWGNACFMRLLGIGMYPAYVLLVFVAAYFMIFRPKTSRGAREYLGKFFEKNGRIFLFSPKVYKLFFSFGVCILDKVSYFSKSGKIKCNDTCVEKISELLKKEKGLIILTSHVGGWQIAGAELCKYGRKVGIVGMKNEGDVIAEISESSRELPKPEIIADTYDAGSLMAAYAALRRGEIVAMHGDRFAGGRGAQVDFFGSRATVPTSAYILAAKSGAPLVQTFCMRKKLFSYEIFAFDPVYLENYPAAELEKITKTCAQNFMRNLELTLKKYPYQWFNFYEFWDK